MSTKETIEQASENYRKSTANQMHIEKVAFIAGVEWKEEQLNKQLKQQ
jgi:hypothetical protein